MNSGWCFFVLFVLYSQTYAEKLEEEDDQKIVLAADGQTEQLSDQTSKEDTINHDNESEDELAGFKQQQEQYIKTLEELKDQNTEKMDVDTDTHKQDESSSSVNSEGKLDGPEVVVSKSGTTSKELPSKIREVILAEAKLAFMDLETPKTAADTDAMLKICMRIRTKVQSRTKANKYISNTLRWQVAGALDHEPTVATTWVTPGMLIYFSVANLNFKVWGVDMPDAKVARMNL